MTDALAQAAAEQAERAQLRAEFVNQVIAAQEEERKRIARELHDSTGQSLSSLLLGLRRLEEAADLESLRERVADLREIVSASLEEVRRMAWELRPSALDDLGLVAALKRYAADYRERNGIEVDLIARGLDGERLPSRLDDGLSHCAGSADQRHATRRRRTSAC